MQTMSVTDSRPWSKKLTHSVTLRR